MDYTIILALMGGLGLFLYGMKLMSDGLEKAAGAKLRRILEIFTTNRLTGMLVGIFFTAVIQSSSAATVMVVSFVNAGLMNLSQAAGVILGANIGVVDLLIFFVSMAALLIVEWIIKKTKLGLAIRSASYSLEATSLMGVDTFKLILSIFLIAGSLAGVAGTLLGAKYTTYPSLGTFYTNKAFICAVFGGLGSLPGAVVGALILGVSEAMISAYVSTTLRDLFAYFLLIVILLIRPSGLLGKSSEDKA